MKKIYYLLIILSAAFGSIYLFQRTISSPDHESERLPDDWFFRQRAFPYQDINYAVYRTEVKKALDMKRAFKNNSRGAAWEFAGPVNICGRITSVALDPEQTATFFIGAASGGVFKTTDAGLSWQPVFDDQPSLSIGDIALAPSDPDVIYVGTGEANAGGGSVSYEGLGIFRSDDGGMSWNGGGLSESGSIGRLVVHPQNPDICYAAAMGRMFSENAQRGVFMTIDGGQSWQNILYLNDSTGAIDIVMDPGNPDVVYAAMWERVRRPDRRSYGGPGCGIYKTTDGGANWEELTNGLPSGTSVGRIGITISPSDPDILYAIYADKTGYFDGVFKTLDGGESWIQTNDSYLSNMYSSYGWWFGRIQVDPADPDIVYGIGFDLYKSSNGGNSWSNISGWDVHVDQHDLKAHPLNPDFVVLGNDGGLYISQNGGSTFNPIENLPVMQFYTCEMDNQHPERLYGGAQDNGTNRTMTGAVDDWESIYGGDGFYVLVDPQNNQYVYAEYQYGALGRSTNGGTSFSYATSGISSSDRFNWMSPVVFSPDDPSVLYFGGNRVYKSTNRAASWTAISGDLSNGPGQFNQTYGTITTLAVSPVNVQVIYAGTDDGNVWVTQNGGGDWSRISWSLPTRWVTRVAADPYDEATVYVTLSGYRRDEYLPHIFRSTDFGQSWTAVSGDLPEVPVNDIIVDPSLDSTLYVATDAGVFVSRNLGQNWGILGEGLPNVPVCDLKFHDDTHVLLAATYGRSMYKIDVDAFVDVHENPAPVAALKVFPNPAVSTVNVVLPGAERTGNFLVRDIRQQVVETGTFSGNGGWVRIDVSRLAPGIYFVEMKSEGKSYSARFIRN